MTSLNDDLKIGLSESPLQLSLPAAMRTRCSPHSKRLQQPGKPLRLAAASHHSSKLRLRLRTQSALQQLSYEQRNKRRVDTRTTLIRAACWYLLPFSACPTQAEKISTATQRMLQTLTYLTMAKPRPKLAESSTQQSFYPSFYPSF
jgi:hypothetical protein